jgi:capsular exopolysaccharide synthesis family protein
MSRLYRALQRAEEERGVRVTHTMPVQRFVPPAAPTVPVEPDDAPDTGECERLKVMLAATRGEVKSTLIVSALSGEGVSTVTARLARSLAAASPTGVLVIDTDARQRTVSRKLGGDVNAGLSELMAKEAARADVIVASSVMPRLFVLGPGRHEIDFAHAHALAMFEELVSELRGAFDHVLIDGGALQHNPAAAILAPRLDSTLLVVEAERSNMPAVRTAANDLRSSGAKLLGVVLNRRRDYVPQFVARRLQ